MIKKLKMALLPFENSCFYEPRHLTLVLPKSVPNFLKSYHTLPEYKVWDRWQAVMGVAAFGEVFQFARCLDRQVCL